MPVQSSPVRDYRLPPRPYSKRGVGRKLQVPWKGNMQRSYEQRILEIEHASFTQLVMSSTGGLGPAATSHFWPGNGTNHIALQ